jgi:ATP-dependent helicase HrpB
MGRASLPIDAVLAEIVAAVRESPCVVIEAPPGAGKTTRVPPAILDAGIVAERESILVLEPRRMAARLPARRVAEERGETLGGAVGYQVQYESVASQDTRLCYMTEGMLPPRVIGTPALPGVKVVVLDEFHERTLQADLALALVRRVQLTSRPDLRIVVMSATLDAGPIAAFLGDAPRVRSEGRTFDVAIEYDDEGDRAGWPLEKRVSGAVRRIVREAEGGRLDGDVLVFLPGAAEIARAAETCADVAARNDLEIVPLHGDLSADEQDRAVRPSTRQRIILSTNVAETSVTLPDVVAVVDGGLARVASHAPWSGLGVLRVAKISRASATQRAGRAGRMRAGRCIRLYTKHDHDARPAFATPEIGRLDLASLCLTLHAAGVRRIDDVPWLTPPPDASVAAAETLLRRLGALSGGDGDAAITDLGRRMQRFPLHPRLARVMCEASSLGVHHDAAALCLALAEGRRSSHPRAKQRLAELARPWERAPADPDAALRRSALAGFPDRVARKRPAPSREIILCGGGTAELSPDPEAIGADLLVALDAEERQTGTSRRTVVRRALPIEAEWLLDHTDALRDERELVWNGSAQRVEVVTRLRYDGIVLEETRRPPGEADAPAAARLLAESAIAAGLSAIGGDAETLQRFVDRVRFAAAELPDAGLIPPGEDAIHHALSAACEGLSSFSFAELRSVSLVDLVRSRLTPAQARLVDEAAPDRLVLPGGRRVKVEYEPGKPPWIASRMQDFFGLAEGPRVARGRVPVVLHLLAPNQRAVQVTTDLAGFWDRHYPPLRRELMRRYPRHAWPEDPRAAAPPGASRR